MQTKVRYSTSSQRIVTWLYSSAGQLARHGKLGHFHRVPFVLGFLCWITISSGVHIAFETGEVGSLTAQKSALFSL